MDVLTTKSGVRRAALCAVMAGLMTLPVWAQRDGGRRGGPPPGGGPESPMSREDVHAAWQLQVDNVASSMNLSAADAGRLREAYIQARRSGMRAMRGNRGDGPPRGVRGDGPPRGVRGDGPPRGERGDGPPRGAREGMRERNAAMNATRDRFLTTVSGFLNENQTALAARRLSARSPQWDMLVNAASGMNLGADQTRVLTLINDYAIDGAALARNARRGGDMESARASFRELRGRLDNEMSAILSAPQFQQWQKASRLGGPRGPRGGGGEHARGGRPGGPPRDGQGGRGPRGGARGEHPPPRPPQR